MVEGEHYPLSRHEHLTIILSITIITIMLMTVTWLVVVCRVPPSPGEELTARCDVVGVAAVPGVEGGVTELFSACFCSVKF